jgi:hypothetical protein
MAGIHRERLVFPIRLLAECLFNAGAGLSHVGGVDVVPGKVAAGPDRCHRGRPRTHEGVEHEVAVVGVEVDEPSRQGDGERRGVADARGRLGWDLPDVGGGLHELVAPEGGRRGQVFPVTLTGGEGAVEPALAGNDDPLGQVTQDGVGGPLERAPRAGTGRATGLVPDHLAAQQEPELVLEDADDVRGQRPVRPPADIGHVDRDPSTRLQLAHALGEHVLEHLQVLEVGGRDVTLPDRLLVLLAGEVGGRRHHQGHRGIRDFLHLAGVADEELVDCLVRVHGLVRAELGGPEARREGAGVVVLPAGHAEARCLGRFRRSATLPLRSGPALLHPR